MPPSQPEQPSDAPATGPDYFATTHWSIVLTAGQNGAPGTEQALEKLRRAYWYPLFAYVRRRGHNPHDAEDLTQEFFARFLEKNYLKDVAREKGRDLHRTGRSVEDDGRRLENDGAKNAPPLPRTPAR